jgi:exosortase A-associated hydrolase 2
MEEFFYFKNISAKNLFGAIHYPEEKSSKGVLICHPLFEEKLHVHRVLVDFSRLLSSAGFNVMRFDYYGEGDSAGQFEEATVKTRLFDINSALGTFKSKIPMREIALLGVRFGATLASLYAETTKEINALVLWAPILRGKDYLHQLLRMNLTHQVVVYKKVVYTREDLIKGLDEGKKVNVEGYEITAELYQQVSEVNLLTSDKSFNGNTSLFQFPPDSSETNLDLDKLKNLYAKCNHSEILKSTDPPFWTDMKYYPPDTTDLFKKTLDWLKVNF